MSVGSFSCNIYQFRKERPETRGRLVRDSPTDGRTAGLYVNRCLKQHPNILCVIKYQVRARIGTSWSSTPIHLLFKYAFLPAPVSAFNSHLICFREAATTRSRSDSRFFYSRANWGLLLRRFLLYTYSSAWSVLDLH